MKQIVSISHNDLDALGCQLNIEKKFPNQVEYFNTNYVNLPEIVHNVVEYSYRNIVKFIIVSDVSFSQCKHLLAELGTLNIPILFVDHHIYPDGYFTDLPSQIKVIHNLDRCASELLNEYFDFPKDVEGTNLFNLCALIGKYDLWKTKDNSFITGFYLNEYFWYNMPVSIDLFMNRFIKSKYTVPQDFKDICNVVRNEATKHIDVLYNKNLVHEVNGVIIAFTDDYYNHLLYQKFKDTNNVAMIICSSYGSIRVRFNQDSDLSHESKLNMKVGIINDPDSGHINAFTYKMGQGAMNEFVPELQRISGIIDKYR